jgi:S-DNA-T family DNA segregation ATPase FtsK/SpoIIIE
MPLVEPAVSRPFQRQGGFSRAASAPGRFDRRADHEPLDDEASAPPQQRDRLRDLTALALLAGVVFLVVALATADAADPPYARFFPPNAVPTNACGLAGAVTAFWLSRGFGIGSWCVVAALAALVVALLRRRELADLPLRTAAAILATTGACTLLAMHLPDWVPRPLWGPGGLVGETGRALAEQGMARTGGTILVVAATLAASFVAADGLILRAGGAAAVAAAAVGAALGAGLGAGLGGVGRLVARMLPARAGDTRESRPGIGETEEGDAGGGGWPFRLLGRTGAEPGGPDESPGEEHDDDAASATGTVGGLGDHDEDGEAFEPTVRVRRRLEAGELASDDRGDDGDEDEADASDPEAVEDEPEAAPVPIRSRATRRRPAAALVGPELDPGADYQLPSIDLLLPGDHHQFEAQEQEVREKARLLEKTFAEFGFRVRVVEIETGPVISQYEIELEAGLRLSKITNLADDLAIALRVPSVRIVAPIPGKNSVGIEVPNTERQMVRLREVIEETQTKSRSMKIPLYLGKDVAGNPMVVDMASMPHLLIAGRTGTGKSVCLNSIIVSMLMTRRPDEVRMLMIDPKMVELTPYKSLPHLMHPVVTDMKKAEAILAWAVEKMEQRYALLAKVGVRHLTQYNALGRDELLRRIKPETGEEAAAIPTTMPFIVMIADEIADMMMTAGKEIEAHIIRLAQKSRAVGIHLVLATQKPTVDVITGLIKSNLPARIAFQVASRTDSRVVLDEMGAERLLGNGDMLFLSPGTSQILRGQGTFVSDDEINAVMATVGTSDPQYAAELVNLQPAGAGDSPAGGAAARQRDDLYEQAVEVVIREGRGSVSLLQRALGVGYGRGARLIDYMAEDGVVGQYAGSQAREVLLTLEQWAERNGTQPPPADPPPRRLKIQPHATIHPSSPEVDGGADPDDDADEHDDEYDDEYDDESDDPSDDDGNDGMDDDEGDDSFDDDDDGESFKD